jgi:hypothetical protein
MQDGRWTWMHGSFYMKEEQRDHNQHKHNNMRFKGGFPISLRVATVQLILLLLIARKSYSESRHYRGNVKSNNNQHSLQRLHLVTAPSPRKRATRNASTRSSHHHHHHNSRLPWWATLVRGGGGDDDDDDDDSSSAAYDKSSSDSNSSKKLSNNSDIRPHHHEEERRRQGRDDFVQAAPLIVAMVCRDGVAILAAHTRAQDESEILLYNHNFILQQQRKRQQQQQQVLNEKVDLQQKLQEESSSMTKNHNNDHDDNDTPTRTPLTSMMTTKMILFQDLPGDFCGPFRIQSLMGTTTALVSTGWRADCDHLMSVCQMQAARKAAWLGKGTDDPYHGHILATELSLYMAQRALYGVCARASQRKKKESILLCCINRFVCLFVCPV